MIVESTLTSHPIRPAWSASACNLVWRRRARLRV